MGKRGCKLTPLEDRFWAKVDKLGPKQPHMKTRCWVWAGCACKWGYGQIREGGSYGKTLMAHRVAWYLFSGEWPALCVLHKCDNPVCVRSGHLFLGTNKDNVDDRERKGRGRVGCGERQHKAKLTREKVVMIRLLYSIGRHTQRALAKIHGVSQGAIAGAVLHKTWK